MANCINYDCADQISDQLLIACDGDLLGGSSAVVFLACNHQLTDPSDATQITTEIAAGRAWKYTDISISIEKASPVKITPPTGCAVEKVINYDRTGNYLDGNVNETNRLNYNALFKGSPLGGMIIWECSSEQVTWIDSAIQFEGDRVLPASNKEIQKFDAQFKWISPDMPSIHVAPVGIFN